MLDLERSSEQGSDPTAPRVHRQSICDHRQEEGAPVSRGEQAERRVEERLRAALPEPEYRLYVNVHWTGPTHWKGPARDGEADAVITHPEYGLLVLEVKAGEPSVDGAGHWHLGPIELKESPFEQASKTKHFLRAKLVDLPGWPPHHEPLAGHAVAFPDVDLESLPRGHSLLGIDAPVDLVLDAHALETTDGVQRWLDRVFDFWRGDGGAAMCAMSGRPMERCGPAPNATPSTRPFKAARRT
jgi:hypothetical protein